jgi:hypothetical protein
VIGLRILIEWELNEDVMFVVLVIKNWIPGGTGEAVRTGQLHGVTARAPILGRWFITLFCNY